MSSDQGNDTNTADTPRTPSTARRGRGTGTVRNPYSRTTPGNTGANTRVTATPLGTSTLHPPNFLTPDLRTISGTQGSLPGVYASEHTAPAATAPSQNTADAEADVDYSGAEDNSSFDTLKIPDGYTYSESANTDATDADKLILDKETDLDKAVETLIPQEDLIHTIKNLRNTMNGASIQCRKAITSYDHFDSKPDLLRRSIDIHPTLILPHGLEVYPTTLKPIFNIITAHFDANVANFKKVANDAIHKNQQFTVLKYKVDRFRIFTSQLIHNPCITHIEYYQMTHPVSTTQTTEDTTPAPDLATLATHATHQLLKRIDLQMLEYLDINRDKLLELFIATHKPGSEANLSEDNKRAIDFAATTMLGYIKPATCLYLKAKDDISTDSKVKATLSANMKARLALRTTAAVNEAITEANLPKDDKTFRESVTSIVIDLKNTEKQKRLQQKKEKTKPKPKPSKPDKTGTQKDKAKKGTTAKAKHPKPSPKEAGARKHKSTSKPNKGKSTTTQKTSKKVKIKGILKTKDKTKSNKTNASSKTKTTKTKTQSAGNNRKKKTKQTQQG